MTDDFAFALRAKAEASEVRNRSKTGLDGPTSDNDDYIAYAAAFAWAIADPVICARFWSHVDKDGPIHQVLGTRCWLWTANLAGHARKTHPANSRPGQFTYTLHPHVPCGGRNRQTHVYAHRFAWAIANGPIPVDMDVLHHCDVPPCVNSAHHFLGTHDDNMKDAARKHRLTVPRRRLLSFFERMTIYRAEKRHGLHAVLAQQYGVSEAYIAMIRNGRFVGAPQTQNGPRVEAVALTQATA